MSAIYDIPVTTLDGRETTMADWAGHVLLIVNTASGCGFTNQYGGLQHLFDEYQARGFFVIGVPCNQFKGQEPGSAEEIAEFCSTSFGVSFPMLAKSDVNGDAEHPLYTLLKQTPDADGVAGDVQWNFEKFLVDDAGGVVGRFRPGTDPEDDAVIDLIERHLPL
ncbi:MULTISPECIES: glutathione peroxidase [unclassified Corynebacterium]|uniref:glutathione peroxidase n=1 Tax=unclassified Corynebacterium TaxID=2624378 RepID=UPI003524D746